MIAFFLMVLFSQCEEQPQEIQFEGFYHGTFYRNNSIISAAPSQVQLFFGNGTFTGSSNTSRYPAICRGSYQISNEEIVFTDSCFWTADFDWTLILSGSYEYSEKQGEIILIKEYENGSQDTYRLKSVTCQVNEITCLDIPPENELCDAYFERWFFNTETGTCSLKAYSGCSQKGFETEEACLACACN